MQPGTLDPSQSSAAGAMPIDEDALCIACGYNVRGLSPTGMCPECYFSIETTLWEIADRRRMTGEPLWLSDRRWLNDLVEGTALVLIVLVLTLAFRVVPDAAWTFRSRSREVLLATA